VVLMQLKVQLFLCIGVFWRTGSGEVQKGFSSGLLCTFNVHNITVTHIVLLSEHTVTDRHSTVCYVRSVCTTLL